jgi:hypothetical protein
VVENDEADDDNEDPFSEDGAKSSSSATALTTPENKKLRRSKRSKSKTAESSKKMKCQLCEFDTDQGDDLHLHYMDEHTKEDLVTTIITVTYPDSVEDSDADLSAAVRSAQKRPAVLHTCPVCQKNIAGKNNLDKHLIRHSSQKPFKCDECKKTFSAKRDLQLHEMRHHSKERPHVCTICQKG